MPLIKGRLGLDSANIPYSARHGLCEVGHGRLYVEYGAFAAVRESQKHLNKSFESIVRESIRLRLRSRKVLPEMIETIKGLLD